MKDSESTKEYSDKLIGIANKVRALGTNLSDNRLVQKILVSVPERYEATIASLENTKNLSKLKVIEMQGRAHVVVQQEEDQLFVATCFSSVTHCDGWLGDSGCTNDMTSDKELFKDLDKSFKSRVKIGNDEYLEVKGKGTVSIESCAGTKLITEVLFVPEIDQNLLSIGQLVEKGFKVLFEERKCLISDSNGNELFKIKMQYKSFSLDPLEEQIAFKCQVTTGCVSPTWMEGVSARCEVSIPKWSVRRRDLC
ncbi:uncharacterized protein LOC120089156 [Benincasa hispida]|uniref:uncharacterized protein LOC120089156 n=1 Tax=Benincasa hispida TaxID=102211 RepID=UPI0018FF9BE1|nr:uncharacterized protein LOC120089156 [Benincasa hispida]